MTNPAGQCACWARSLNNKSDPKPVAPRISVSERHVAARTVVDQHEIRKHAAPNQGNDAHVLKRTANEVKEADIWKRRSRKRETGRVRQLLGLPTRSSNIDHAEWWNAEPLNDFLI